MYQAIINLIENPAFWAFLGVFMTAYFSYKGIAKKYPSAHKKIQNVSSFEELKEVVAILQNELEKKDVRHQKDLEVIKASYDRKLLVIQEEIAELRTERRQMIDVMRDNGLIWPPNRFEESDII